MRQTGGGELRPRTPEIRSVAQTHEKSARVTGDSGGRARD
jgi:hypothetical protein